MGAGEALWDSLQARYPRFAFSRLGVRSASVVSAFLQTIDLAISPTPWNLTGKSSAVASLLEHGVPVVVNRPAIDYGLRDVAESTDPLLIPLDQWLPDRLRSLQRDPPKERLSGITAAFLRSLSVPLS
jgi:hypothetical protein